MRFPPISVHRSLAVMFCCLHFFLQLLPEYEADAKKLEEKVETFKRLTDMEGKVDKLQKELQWALVAEIEKVSAWCYL